ncbi:MAG TPA: Holliday junction branch migration protein RuvA [Syntrophomonas sp.]|nr:Holliday junction branch migration protein RuvA [Syntrophomonas sp.]HRW11612.1 Holliday junction branch migration protein RuvA [Syntrophomonas sp.]
MIAFLKGTLFQMMSEAVVIETGGLGYEVQIHGRMAAQLPAPGGQVMVHTFLQVMENEFKLYGFASRGELELFKLLMGVSGIGARAAMNLLGKLDGEQLCSAIISGDEKVLVGVPGIGKKTAQRLIFELRDKLGNYQGTVSLGGENANAAEEILQAMESLGYSRSEIYPILTNIQSSGELSPRVEDNIKKILKRQALLMKR